MHSCSGLLRSRALYASLKIIPYSSGKCKCFPEISRRNFARRKRCGKKRFKNIEISPNERQNCQKPWRLGRRHFVTCPRSRSRNGAGRISRRRVSFDFYFILSSRAFLPSSYPVFMSADCRFIQPCRGMPRYLGLLTICLQSSLQKLLPAD